MSRSAQLNCGITCCFNRGECGHNDAGGACLPCEQAADHAGGQVLRRAASGDCNSKPCSQQCCTVFVAAVVHIQQASDVSAWSHAHCSCPISSSAVSHGHIKLCYMFVHEVQAVHTIWYALPHCIILIHCVLVVHPACPRRHRLLASQVTLCCCCSLRLPTLMYKPEGSMQQHVGKSRQAAGGGWHHPSAELCAPWSPPRLWLPTLAKGP